MSSRRNFSEAELAAAAWSKLQRETSNGSGLPISNSRHRDKCRSRSRSRSRSRDKDLAHYHRRNDWTRKDFVRSSECSTSREYNRHRSRSRSNSNSRKSRVDKSSIYQEYVKPVDSRLENQFGLNRENIGE